MGSLNTHRDPDGPHLTRRPGRACWDWTTAWHLSIRFPAAVDDTVAGYQFLLNQVCPRLD